jgi:hypothetical protein
MCQLWAEYIMEVILFDTHSKLYKVDFIIPFINEETKDHKCKVYFGLYYNADK